MHTRVQIDGWDPVTASPITLFAVSHDEPGACHAGGGTWWPVLVKLPPLRYDLFDGAFGGSIAAPSSSLTMRTEPWAAFGRYALADARFRLWTGDGDANLWTQRVDARVTSQPRLVDGAAEIEFAVDDRWLDGALLTTYAGTTGAEGPAAMKGQAKPLALGAPRYVPGKLIDSVNNVFQVSAYGAIEGFEAALERLARFGAPVGDYPSYAALIAATVPAGTWATAKAVGMARFGAPPVGQICFLLKGDKAGTNGWARKPGALIRRLAILSGGAGKIHDASLDALDIARPYNLSIYLDAQTSARELVQNLAASVNAVAGVSWLGKLFVAPVGLATPTVTLAADGSAFPPVTSVEQIGVGAPWKKLAIGAARAWQVHALADIAFTVTLVDLGDYDPATTYREGNIVQDQGASWRYLSPTASAGNAPPVLPDESNAWWKIFANVGPKGDDGVPAVGLDLTPSSLVAKYDDDDVYSGGAISFVAARQNTTTGVVWKLYDAAGALAFSGTAAAFAAASSGRWTTTDNDHLTLTAAGVPVEIADKGGAFSLEAVTGSLLKRVRIAKIKDGSNGLSTVTQGSVNGMTGWHTPPTLGDQWLRISNDSGATFGAAFQVTGSPGYTTPPNSAVIINATSGDVTKGGELPKSIPQKIYFGNADVTASVSAAIIATPSTGLAMTWSSNVLQIGTADVEGWFDVTWSISGTPIGKSRYFVTRKRDNPPAETARSQSGGYDAGGTVFGGSPALFGSILTVQADGAGQLQVNVALDYSCTYGGDFYASGKVVFRLAGSGGTFLDWTSMIDGSGAYNGPGAGGGFDESFNGRLLIDTLMTGLTAGQSYEVTTKVAKGGGSAGGIAEGGTIVVKQP